MSSPMSVGRGSGGGGGEERPSEQERGKSVAVPFLALHSRRSMPGFRASPSKNKYPLNRYEKRPWVETLLARLSLMMWPVGASRGRMSQVAVPLTPSTSSASVNFVLWAEEPWARARTTAAVPATMEENATMSDWYRCIEGLVWLGAL